MTADRRAPLTHSTEPRATAGQVLATALVLAGLSAVLGVLASRYATFPLDERLTPLGRDAPLFAGAARAITEYEYAVVGSAGVLLLSLIAWRRRWDLLVVAIVAGSLRYFLQIPKDLVDRSRPAGDFAVLDIVSDSSFPSGHVMTAVTVFGLWFLLAPELLPRVLVLPVRCVAIAIIVLTMTARMWAGVHWFSDTVGGVLWASAVIAFALAIGKGVLRQAQHERDELLGLRE